MSFDGYRLRTFGLAVGGTFVGLGVTAGLTALEVTDRVAPSFTADDRLVIGWLVVALVAGVVVGALRVHRLRSVRVQVRKEFDVRVVVGDYMDNLTLFPAANCAFGVNDRISVTGLLPDSIHQLFLDRYVADLSAAERQALHDEAMARSHVSASATDERRDRVPAGSVVCLGFDDRGTRRVAFLLANSTQGQLGNFDGIGATRQAVSAVWEQHDRLGITSRELLFPLVGTGHANELTRMYSIYRIVDEYFDHLEEPERTQFRVKRLIISVGRQALDDGEVDLAVIHEYVRARAKLHDAMLRP